MKPKGTLEPEYAMLLEGLEKLAGYYKTVNHKSSGGRFHAAKSVLWHLRKKGFKAARKRYRELRSGVDNDLRTDGKSRKAGTGYYSETKDIIEDTEAYTDISRYFISERIAVYMAMFGQYDTVREPVIHPDNVDYYLISDIPPEKGSAWNWVDPVSVIPEEYCNNPVLSNRWCKMHPQKIFPEHKISVYLDSNFLVVSDLTALVSRMRDYPVAMFRHKNRDCVYKEIEACLIKEKAPRDALLRDREMLRLHGVPEHAGFLEAPIIVRKHHEAACIQLMDAWWRAFLKGAGRDQISLADCLWTEHISTDRLGTLGLDFRKCNLLIAMPHGSIQGGK